MNNEEKFEEVITEFIEENELNHVYFDAEMDTEQEEDYVHLHLTLYTTDFSITNYNDNTGEGSRFENVEDALSSLVDYLENFKKLDDKLTELSNSDIDYELVDLDEPNFYCLTDIIEIRIPFS